jgi:hypothetical protein
MTMDAEALDGWRALACAVLLRAHKDAMDGNGHSQDARCFLGSDGARWLAVALDLDPAGLDHALGELPAAKWKQLSFWSD